MQIYWDCPNLGQLNMHIRYRILLELGKQQRKKLTVFLESGKTKSSFLKVFPSLVQLLNGLLENLRRNFTEFWKFLLSLGQVIKLIDFTGKLQLRGEDVLFFQRASINQALTTKAPIFYLPKCIVKCNSTDFHPLNKYLLLSGIWINSVAMGNCNHSSTVLRLLTDRQSLNVNLRGIEPLKLTWGSPCIPTLTLRIQRGSYSSPKPPRLIN